MPGDAGQHIDKGAGRDFEAEVARPRFEPAVDRQRERRAAQLGRVEAKNEMMHDRIADQRHFQDFARARPPQLAAASPISASIASRTARVSSSSPPGFIMT